MYQSKLIKMSTCETNGSTGSEMNATLTEFENSASYTLNNGVGQKSMDVNSSSASISTEDGKYTDAVIKVPPLLNSRERRNVSSPSILQDAFVDPQSPSSSSSTSQATSANDATFEPTIEMMVNDFDDEQTLNEEEALASVESQDPNEEINTLKKESEMPLEELLAKYRALPPLPPSCLYSEPLRKKPKKSSLHREKHKQKHKQMEVRSTQISKNEDVFNKATDISKVVDAGSGASISLPNEEKVVEFDEKCVSGTLSAQKSFTPSVHEEKNETNDSPVKHSEIPKVRRSHLLDLYPEGTFDNVVVVNDAIAGNRKETLYGAEDDEEDEEIEDEEDEDYKKKVMIGTSYQATIPVGLSQYGDILPYENEDKLIWEPSQVSEREVEEYLIKIRDIKSNQQGEEDDHSAIESNLENQSKENGRSEKNIDNLENNSFLANFDSLVAETTVTTETDSQAVVKDNEQALHLLVQCGYDFKEALRRKRLNALPLNDCMSLWSEEECQKFEEGIQKYGKDFLKIRQNQVRTRTMRELVQFYYLWKKSERRDHNFANADTVDHMDIYLNEDNEYGSNPASVLTSVGSPVGNTSNCTGAGRSNNSSQKNISIMTNTSTTPAVTNFTTEKNISNSCLQQHHHQQQHQHKRRTHSCNQSTLNLTTTNDFSNENSSNTLTYSTK